MTNTERKTLEKGLAWRVATAAQAMDPYEFRSEYETFREGVRCTLSAIQTDPRPVFETVESWKEFADEETEKALSAIMQDLAELMPDDCTGDCDSCPHRKRVPGDTDRIDREPRYFCDYQTL